MKGATESLMVSTMSIIAIGPFVPGPKQCFIVRGCKVSPPGGHARASGHVALIGIRKQRNTLNETAGCSCITSQVASLTG